MVTYNGNYVKWHRLYNRFIAGIPLKHQWTFFWYLMDHYRDEDLDMPGMLVKYKEFKEAD